MKDARVLMAADQPRMAEKLQEANMLLEDIQRGLNDYLEKKRLFFPRYLALSFCSELSSLSHLGRLCLLNVGFYTDLLPILSWVSIPRETALRGEACLRGHYLARD